MEDEIRFEVSGGAGGTRVTARWKGQELELSPLWLRERCQDGAHLDARTRQRLYNPHAFPPDLELRDAQVSGDSLRLSFSDGYQGTYDTGPLKLDFDEWDGCPAPVPWRPSTLGEVRFDWEAFDAGGGEFVRCLEAFLTYGFVIVGNTPTDPLAILDIAGRFGKVRDTNFGKYFEVYARLDPEEANDLAYTSLGLDPHTDNPYRDPVPGIQLLHCLANETSGGLSTLADSLAVTDELRRRDPGAFELLATVPVRYHFWDRDAELIERLPMVCRDWRGRVTGIHYSPKLDHLPLLPPADVRRFHEARRLLADLFSGDEFEFRFMLQPGEFVMFDNNRVVHGRTGFDRAQGRRHLQGCYIDRDHPRSLYRVLRRQGVRGK